MPTTLITLQDERTISLPAGLSSSLTQENMNAASILNYQLIVPMIRVVRSADNALTTSGVLFHFLTAATLISADDEQAKGTRFFAVSGYDIIVRSSGATPISGAGANGMTYAAAAVSGIIPALTNLGGLLLWKCVNLDGTFVNTLKFEMHAICRGA